MGGFRISEQERYVDGEQCIKVKYIMVYTWRYHLDLGQFIRRIRSMIILEVRRPETWRDLRGSESASYYRK